MNNSILFIACICLGIALVAGCGTKKKPAIIAHRGSSYIAPENTAASARKAWEENADAVEIDIYLSKDGRIVVMHDLSTKRTTGVDMVIADTVSDTLRTLDAGSWKGDEYADEKLPFFEEIVETVPAGKKLFVEIKCGTEVLPALKAAIEASGKRGQMVVIGFGFETVVECKKLMPDIPTYWLTSTKKDETTNAFEPLDAGLIAKVNDAGLDGLDVHFGGLTKEFAEAVGKAKLGLYVWTVDDPVEAKRLVELNVDGITTNRPGWLREQAGL